MASSNAVSAKASRLGLFIETMNAVYGEWRPEASASWRPKRYSDTKSRYLWTDAFGVCNYITLAQETGLAHYLDQADALIKDVHETLGRQRDGKSRLLGATDECPVKGGLRIGKLHDEDHPDGDGQYFHYLSKWAFALNRMSRARGDSRYNNLAIDLLRAIHPRFVHQCPGAVARSRMYWKMSIDLSRPAVRSEGNLDPIDGYVTYRLVQEDAGSPVLQEEIDELFKMVQAKWQRYNSDDPLDLGEALWLTHWFPTEAWASHIANVSLESLDDLWKAGYFNLPSSRRLAFREFGTALGLAVSPSAHANETWNRRVEKLLRGWREDLYSRDRDITPVMFCSALIPGVWQRGAALVAPAAAGAVESSPQKA